MLALVLALSTVFSAATPAPDTLEIVPRFQSLDLQLDPRSNTWSGSVRSWLTVRHRGRRFLLRLHGPEVSRVEMTARTGAVPLAFGALPGDSLLVETSSPLDAGPAGLNVAFLDTLGVGERGMVRAPGGGVTLRRADGLVMPAWPRGTAATPWRLDVHVPAPWRVTANLPRVETTRQGPWRTWSFASRAPLPADSLRVEIRREGAPASRDAAGSRAR